MAFILPILYVSTGLLKPFKSYIDPDYLVLWLNSPLGRGFSEKNTLGKGVSQGNLNLSLIRSFLVSIPPFAEQQRIMTKIDQLMIICNKLKSRIMKSQTVALHLSDTIAHHTDVSIL